MLLYYELMTQKLGILKLLEGKGHITKSKNLYLNLYHELYEKGLRMFNLSSCVEPTSCATQKYRLLYTINYGTA